MWWLNLSRHSLSLSLTSVHTLVSYWCSHPHSLTPSLPLSGTGSVLKIQELLHICSESFKSEDLEEAGEGGKADGKGKEKEKSEGL